MADNKNQHFVPKVHLKAFSPDGPDGKRLHLFNLTRGQTILNAPIRGQCSRDYFYGQAPEVDEVFKDCEGLYGSIIRHLADPSSDATAVLGLLRDIAYLQLVRTEKALAAAKHYFGSTHDLAFAGRPIPPKDELPPDWVIARDAVEHWRKTVKQIGDLAGAVVVNETGVRFITSDNPAVLTNRFYCQKIRRTDFGVANAGTILVMPLGPKLAFIAYDRHCYQTSGKIKGRIRLSRPDDVSALNALQILNCRNNLYFTEERDADRIAALALGTTAARIDEPHQFSVWVPDSQEGQVERFRRASEVEAIQNTRRIILSRNINPTPAAWPSFLPFRRPVTAYVSDTAMGVVREASCAHRPEVKLVKRRY